MLRTPRDEPRQGAPAWVVTFGDVMALLLAFFVMLLSLSELEVDRFRAVAGSLREAFGVRSEIDLSDLPAGRTPALDASDAPIGTLGLIETYREVLERSGLAGRGEVHSTGRGVVLRLDGDVLFDSGDATLKPDADEVLRRVAAIAAARPERIDVEGHTDDVPVAGGRYPSNWELSGARAGSAVRRLIELGVPAARIRALGYASTRPVGDNTAPEGRARNRRVEFVFRPARGLP